MYLKGCDEEGTSIDKQWGIVGDTFIVGCQIPDEIIYPDFSKENPDMSNEKYNTRLGIYKQNCGLENVMCSWGHDEYLYQILKYNKIDLPEEAYYIIRYNFDSFLEVIIIGRNKPKAYSIIITRAEIRNALKELIFIVRFLFL